MDCFKIESTVNKDTYIELTWHLIPITVKIAMIIILIGCAGSAIGGHYEAAFTGLTMVIIFSLSTLFFHKRDIKTKLQRQQECEGTSELKLAISFLDENIKIHNLRAGGTIYMKYDSIVKLAETKNLYVLFTKAKQFIAVNKTILFQEQKNNDFIRFVKDKCINVKWRTN
jgi:hypothetical protein